MYKSIAIHTRSTYWTDKESTEELTIDADDLAQEITSQSNKLYEEGYEVISVTPITSGNMSHGSGYFQTESVIITARKIKKVSSYFLTRKRAQCVHGIVLTRPWNRMRLSKDISSAVPRVV